MRDHLQQLLAALLASRDLRAQIGEVLVGIARRIRRAGEQRAQLGLAHAAGFDELEVVDQHALLIDRAGSGRHRPWRDAADVGVVAARGDVEQQRRCSVASNTGITTVTSGRCVPPLIRIVEDVDVAWRASRRAFRRITVLIDSLMLPRCTGMCGALAIKSPSASKIAQEKSRRSLMFTEYAVFASAHAHLLGDRHEEVVEHLEHDGIDGGARRLFPVGRGAWRSSTSAPCVVTCGAPAGLDDGGGVLLADDRRADDDLAGGELLALEHGAVAPTVARVHAHARDRGGLCASGVQRGNVRVGGRANRLDRQRLDDDTAVGHQEGEARAVCGLEPGAHRRQVAARDRHRGVGSIVLEVRASHPADEGRVDAMPLDLGTRGLLELGRRLLHGGDGFARQRALERALPGGRDVGEAHAERGQHARERVDVHAPHAELVGDDARMLPARAAEAGQRVLRDVVAALDRDELDRVGHVRDRDAQEAGRDHVGRARLPGRIRDLRGQRFELRAHGVGIDRRVGSRAEDLRKESWAASGPASRCSQ